MYFLLRNGCTEEILLNVLYFRLLFRREQNIGARHGNSLLYFLNWFFFFVLIFFAKFSIFSIIKPKTANINMAFCNIGCLFLKQKKRTLGELIFCFVRSKLIIVWVLCIFFSSYFAYITSYVRLFRNKLQEQNSPLAGIVMNLLCCFQDLNCAQKWQFWRANLQYGVLSIFSKSLLLSLKAFEL